MTLGKKKITATRKPKTRDQHVKATFTASGWHFHINKHNYKWCRKLQKTTCSHLSPNWLWQSFSWTLWRKATDRHRAAAGSSCGSSHKEEALGGGAPASWIQSLWSAQQNVSHHPASSTSSSAKTSTGFFRRINLQTKRKHIRGKHSDWSSSLLSPLCRYFDSFFFFFL